MKLSALMSLTFVFLAGPLHALDDPNDTGRGCLVEGLDPNGDGFLSIRTGPGTGHQEVARASNGDALLFDSAECRGQWCFAKDLVSNNRSTGVNGWFYTAWCQFYP